MLLPALSLLLRADPRPTRGLSGVRSSAAVAAAMDTVLFVECGMGADQHGQQPTKACVRACRNAIEFNSLPSMRQLIPGGYAAMKLHVNIGVPSAYVAAVDVEQVSRVFPYGDVHVHLAPGGLLADSGVVLEAMGDSTSDMIIAVACVTVGYDSKAKPAPEVPPPISRS